MIKGLTDDEAAFPRIGILRKGDAKVDEKRPGKDLQWLRFTSGEPEVVTAFHDLYGDKPTDVRVLLPYRTVDENFPCWREEWGAGSLKHRCDGKTCVLWQDEKGQYKTTPKPCPGACKPVGRLAVIIPELRRLAFVTALTTSQHDIRNLSRQLRAVFDFRKSLVGIPMVLRRRPCDISVPEVYPKGHAQQYKPTGKRVRREKWLLSIEADPTWVALQLERQKALALPTVGDKLPLLEAPDAEDNGVIVDSETGEIVDTSHPEAPDTPPDVPPGFAEASDDEMPDEDFDEEGAIDAIIASEEKQVEAEKQEAAKEPAQQPEIVVGTANERLEYAKRALTKLNDETLGAYASVNDVLKAIRIEKNDKEWAWPIVSDTRAWGNAYAVALAHAKKR